ncbi:MAG: mechanosensitive ion channel family protein [Treponema sp.]|jgi:small conductance mechanosensitive channel|nr:mechanosensitive ion channel family protein [Treponema sp.]
MNMREELLRLWEYHADGIIGFAKNAVAAAVIIIIGLVLSKGGRKLINQSGKPPVDETVLSLLRLIVRYGIFTICVIMILNVFGVNTASLIAVLGAAGVAVGLALKDTLGNIAAGIILLALGSCRRGEYIEFGEYAGTVKDINLFTTILETFDGIYISAPNSSIWGNPLKNYTRNGKRRMELLITIALSDSIDTAFEVMRSVIASEPRFLKDPAPQVILQALQDSGVCIAIRAWASVGDYWDIYWEQMRNLKARVEEAGLHIPVPRRDVRVSGEFPPAQR